MGVVWDRSWVAYLKVALVCLVDWCVAIWAQVVVGVVLGRCPVALNMEQWLLDIGEESPDGRCHVFLVTPHDFGLPVGHAW